MNKALSRWVIACVTTVAAGCGGGGASVAPVAPAASSEPTPATAGGIDSITAHDLRAHVELLASDDYLGRETLEPGAQLAAEHLARELARYGLTPMPGMEDFQVAYTLHALGFDPKGTYGALRIGDRDLRLAAGKDFTPFPFSDAGETKAPVVFAGYGIVAPELGRDDYAGLDVKGKYVFVLRYAPRANEGQDDPFARSEHTYFATKARVAAERGAVGMILVTGPLHRDGGEDLRLSRLLRTEPIDRSNPSRRGQRDATEPPFLAIHVSQAAAGQLVASSGRPLRDLQAALDAGATAASLALSDTTATLAVAPQTASETVTAYNVAGFLPGSDPALADEWVVVGAHYDHLGGFAGGDTDGDGIFNGADDNASGTSGLLELAQAFATAPQRPRRSVLFVGFSGEEKGLLGSTAMLEQSLLPRERVVFMLNLDMIGRNPERPVDVVGDGYASGVRELVETANATVKLPIALGGDDYSGASDHHPFYARGVPFLFFFTGLHDDYHQQSDHADKLAYERMQDIVRLAYGTIEGVASAPRAPRFIHHVTWLGAKVQVEGEGDAARAVLRELTDRARGAEAGLQSGDVVVAVGKEAVADAGAVGQALRDVEPGTRVSLRVERGADVRDVEVERAKTGYLGVFPGGVSQEQRTALALADGEGVLIRGVASDGPAAASGMRDGDILIRIGGLPVDVGSLGMHLARIGAGETVPIVVVRDGQRVELQLTLGERPERP